MPKTPVPPRAARSVQLETSLTAPFEVAGFNPQFNDDASKFTVDLPTPECHKRFDQIVANLRNSGQAVDLKYDLKDEDVGMVATITCPKLPETGPTDQNSAKEFTKFTEGTTKTKVASYAEDEFAALKAKGEVPKNSYGRAMTKTQYIQSKVDEFLAAKSAKKDTPAEGARSKEDDTMRVAINDNHLDGLELDPVETVPHFGAETAFHLASAGPAMARRRALNGEMYDLIQQPNGNYLVKSASADSAKSQTENGSLTAEQFAKYVSQSFYVFDEHSETDFTIEDGQERYRVRYYDGNVTVTADEPSATTDQRAVEIAASINAQEDWGQFSTEATLEDGTNIDGYEDWRKAVKAAYPEVADKLKFKGRVEDGANTISAEVSGEDRSYGVYYPEDEYGVVFGTNESVNSDLVDILDVPDDVQATAEFKAWVDYLENEFAQANQVFVSDSDGCAKAYIQMSADSEVNSDSVSTFQYDTKRFETTKENAFTGATNFTNRKGLTESFQINQDTRAPVYRKHLRTGNTSRLIGDSETSEKLEAGVYHVFKDFDGNTFFERKAIRSDELLRFEDGRREHVLDEIRQFWSLRENFAALGLGHKRGVLMFGPPGGGKSCHARDSGIMMYDGTVKAAQDVVVGDYLMGDDSTPREVLETVTGVDDLYKFTTFSGESFTVNAGHYLHLERLQRNSGPMNTVTQEREPYYVRLEEDVRVVDYLALSADKRHHSKLMKQPVTAFDARVHAVDPYMMGLLLGDGCITGGQIRVYSADKEVAEYVREFAVRNLLHCKESERNGCGQYVLSCTPPGSANTPKGHTNFVKDELVRLQLYGEGSKTKFVPDEYRFDSVDNRLQLLAGLVDTDGHYRTSNNDFEYYTSSRLLADDVCWLARSVGLHATVGEKTINSQHVQDHVGYRVRMCGDVEMVPTRIARKQARARVIDKNPLRYGVKSVEHVGTGEFFGFNVSDNSLYLDENFFVHHNCIIKQVVEDAVNSDNVVIYPKSLDGLANIIREFRDVEPDRHILCVLEDVDGLIQYSEHSMLELFDGDDQVNHVLFLATTNYPERLPARVMRSGRFDTKIEIKQIPREGRIAYLQNKVGTRCKPEDIENYADLTEDFSFAQMREFVAATFALNQEPKAAVTRIRRNFTESRAPSRKRKQLRLPNSCSKFNRSKP